MNAAASAALVLFAAASASALEPHERFRLSNGQVVETFVERDSAGGNGTTFVARRSDGYCVAVFLRAAAPGENAPGLVVEKRYPHYLVLWDKGYSNLVGVEADREESKPRRTFVSVKSGNYGGIGNAVLSAEESPRRDPGLAHIREMATKLSARFRETLRALALIGEGSSDLSSPAFALLERFIELPRELRIDAREPAGGDVPEDVRAFLASSPIPTKDQTGFAGR